MRNTDSQVCAPSGVLLRCHPVSRTAGRIPTGTHATGLCSAHAIKPCLIPNSRGLQVRCLLASNLAPNNIFVISTIDKCVDFPVLVIAKQDSAFDTFAKEKLRCFRK